MLDFDFDKLMSLAKNPLAFEAERARIINSYIKTIPEHRRRAAYTFQVQLDQKRLGMKSEDFIKHCSEQMQENMEKVDALCKSAACVLAQMLAMKDEDPIPDNVVLLKGIVKPK